MKKNPQLRPMHSIFSFSLTCLHIQTQESSQLFRPSYFSTDIPVRTLEHTATVLYTIGKIPRGVQKGKIFY